MSNKENTNIQVDNVPTEDSTKLFRSSHVIERGNFIPIKIGNKLHTVSEIDLLRPSADGELIRKCLNGMSRTKEDEFIDISIDRIVDYQKS